MNKQLTNDERAISGLVGEILLIGIAIVAIGLIAVSVYSYLNKDPETPHLEVTGMANMMTDEIHIKHQGGDPIEGRNLRVLVSVNGITLPAFDEGTSDRWGIRIKGENDVEKNFDRWVLGNILVLDTMPEVNITDDDEIRVTIVSRSASRVIVSGEVFGGLFGNASINRNPIADAGEDQTNGLCEDNAKWKEVWVWFDGSGSYDPDNPDDYTGDNYRGIVSWHWDFGDGNTSDKMWGWHNYSVNGTYYMTLTVTDVDGATDNDTCIVTILPPANLTADAGPDQWVGIGAEVQLNGSGSNGCIKAWKWEFGDGTSETVNASTTTHVYSKEGDYIVNLTVVEDHTGKMANDSCNITVVANGFLIWTPHEGDWVHSTEELIEARVIGMDGYDYTDFCIRSVSSETNYSLYVRDDSGETVTDNTTKYIHNWNTTGLGCGNYTINATTCNTAGTTMTDQITVCVCNIPNLMGFWRFDDGSSRAANDSSCNRNHGIIHGSPTGIIINDSWHALRFNGSSDYVKVANSTSLAMTNKTTVDAWVNSSDAGEQYILAKGDMVFESRSGVVEGGDEVVMQNVSSDLDWDPGFGAGYKRAQTFKLDNNATLNNVSVYIKEAFDWVTGDITVSIHEDGGAGPGTEVASATISDGTVSTSYTWITVPFNCNLTGSNKYWLVLESPDANGGTGSYWWNAGSIWPNGPYLSGEALYSYNSPWTTSGLGGVDMNFALNITTAAHEGVLSTYTDRISMPDLDNFKFIAYYAWLNCTDMNWSESGLELVLVRDDNEGEIQKVRGEGVDVYFYIEIGQSYCEYNHNNNTETWEQDLISLIDDHHYVDGFFFDDLDPAFWTANIEKCGECNTSDLNQRLTNITDHIRGNNQKSIANGVRYYADHCGSDYYMWESFISTNYSGAYHYDDFFNGTAPTEAQWGDDPYVWINGVKKYEYLKAKGVLNKTLAHCYGPPSDDNRSIYGYIASRVLGLKGFSYADINNFANSTTTPLRIAEGLKWDLGTQMNYSVDADAGNLSGRFTNGAVVDCVNWTVAANNANYTTDLISDPLTAHLLNSSSRVTGLDFCLIRGQVDFMHGVLRSSSDLTEWDPGYHVLNATLDAESGTAALYINYTLAAKRTFPNGLPFDFTGSNLTIGANNTGAYGFFNGSIEEVKIYDS